MLEVVRYNPFNGEESSEIYDVESADQLEDLPFIHNAVSQGWECYTVEEFVYIRFSGTVLRIASIKERKNGR